MSDIQFVNPLDFSDWDERVGKFPEATIFHSVAWARLLIESYGFIPFYCIARQGKEIAGILPLMEVRDVLGRKKSVSLPFSDFCEPLFVCPEGFKRCIEFIKKNENNKQWRYLELRGGKRFFNDNPAFDAVYSHEIDLNIEQEVIFKSFHDTTRRNIRKAEKYGLRTIHENSIEAVRSFFHLNCLTRRDHCLPPQPWKFFYCLWKNMLSRKNGFVTLVDIDGRPIAGNLYLVFGKKAFYKYGASDRGFQNMRPSHLAMWEGIKHCREQGFHGLNLGRTEQHHTGLLKYKRSYNAKETIIQYYRFNADDGSFYLKNQSASRENLRKLAFSRLPIPVLRIIGNVLYKFAA